MNLRIHRLAVAEIDHEVDYYESRETGLGTQLEDEVAPYQIKNDDLVILALAHTSRRPGYWSRRRLP